jgi:hypothetical protein
MRTLPPLNIIRADMAYWIADIKFNEQGVKIVELGDGNFAGYKVLDNMYFRGHVWTRVWENILSSEVPVWFIGNYASDPDVVAWETFRKLGGLHSATLETLQQDQHFLMTAKREVPEIAQSIADYQGIIVLKRYNPSQATFANFITRFPNFLILNETSSFVVSDKALTDALFTTEQMKASRPQALILEKKYTRALEKEILDKMAANWFVIKPVNSGRGNGIIMTNRDELGATLRKILVDNRSHFKIDNDYTFKADPPLSFEYWRSDRNSHFIVEEFAESKQIFVDDKPYDPTMRVIFVIRYEEGKMKLDYIDGYWKKPSKSLIDEGTFKERHISKHAPNAEESRGLNVSAEDLKAVEECLAPVLPRLFWNILLDCYRDAAAPTGE